MGHVGSPLSPSLPESPASRHSTSESGSAAKLKPMMLAGLCCVAAAEPAQQSTRDTITPSHAAAVYPDIFKDTCPAAIAHVSGQRQIPLNGPVPSGASRHQVLLCVASGTARHLSPHLQVYHTGCRLIASLKACCSAEVQITE